MKKRERAIAVAVVPAHNEERRLGEVIAKLKALKELDDIVVSDDGSTDRTAEIAKSSGAKIVSSGKNMGVGHATRIGCDYAIKNLGAGVVVLLDADGQHPPEEVPLLLRELAKGYDIVFADRLGRTHDMPLVKRIGNVGLSFATNTLAGTRVSDTQSGFKAFTAGAFKALKLKSNGYEICSEFVLRAGKARLNYDQAQVSSKYDQWTKVKGTNIKTGLSIFLRLVRLYLSS